MEGFLNLKAILGLGFPVSISRIHTAYIGEDSSILGTNEMFGDTMFATKEYDHTTLPHPNPAE